LARKEVRKIKTAGYQKNFLYDAIASVNDQEPNCDGRERDRDVAADMHDFGCFSDARKFRDGVEEVHKEGRDHHEEGGTESKFFADQIGKAFAGDDSHTGAHFLADIEGNGHGD
jgi:hypothetical protein